ncbi:MAG TPA: gas vesicle protein GvpJ [Actinocrinis sp.]|uniref:gas vesicle protein GvpJ n=1 Tax=Actinocrinis sp. TaxID=1920516 RepID=UPI002D2DB98F|nr:gas vesicle protein GvpJ [Actinocrinis sp.]HZU59164.1 gas vesicle protein GvpJ [Actinocrinis sp.]
MTVQPAGGSLDRPNASNLADVVDTILDKGLVIDAYVRVSLVGIELLTIDARVVIASVDTYLRFAEAVNRLDLSEGQQHGLPDLLEDVNKGGAKSRTSGALEAAGEKLSGLLNSDSDDEDDEDDEYEREPAHRDRRR